MLSWEYPPVVVGGLGRHVHSLATVLARAGHEVTVATRHAPGAALDEVVDGVRIVRAPEDPPAIPLDTANMLAWAMAFNHTLTRTALAASGREGFDIVHAHDWLVTHAAVTMRDHLAVPMVATVHATEAGRHQGWLPGDLSRSIHSVESWLGQEASRVLVCSQYMRREVAALFDVPASKIAVIPNGVDLPAWQPKPRQVAAARARFAGSGPLVAFAGRLVHEKGVQHLLAAVPELRSRHRGLRVLIAGDGPQRGDLEETAGRLGISDAVSFSGFVGAELPATMASADVMVVPSIYEPFGMVALEAAAAGAPLVVAATGGLAEIIASGVTGLTFPSGDDAALAASVGAQLSDRAGARRMAKRATAMVRTHFDWTAVGASTAAVYRTVIDGASSNCPAPTRTRSWQPTRIAEGNLLKSAGLLT